MLIYRLGQESNKKMTPRTCAGRAPIELQYARHPSMAKQPQDAFAPLASAEGPEFEALYDIYRHALPPSERKSKRELAAMAAKPEYSFLVAARSGTVVGFSVVFTPRENNFRLLEYMAIHRNHRGKGLGEELFRRSLASAPADAQTSPVLLEVDSDQEASADTAIRTRRLRFYKRLGCLRIKDLTYLLPLPSATAPPLMQLLICFPKGRLNIGKAQLERWIKTVYTEVYGCSPDDPRIVAMLRPLGDPVELAV